MDRRDFYFRQPVTEGELDGAFDAVEAAIWNLAADHELIGIVTAMDVAQNGTPNLTVNVSGPGRAYDEAGRRIAIPSTQNVNVAVDETSTSTTVAGVGNEKWLSVFIEFDRTLSDPRIDGNSLGLFFQHTESFRFVVRQGAEAGAGLATRPPLDSDLILLADVKRTQGVTSILNAVIDVTRRQDVYRYSAGSLDIAAGTNQEATQQLLQHLSDHIDGSGSTHTADAIDYNGSGTWANAITGLPATDVDAALDAVVSQLASQAAQSGADRIGIRARTTWLGGRTNVASDVYAAIDKIITDLAATGAADDGAERIGAAAAGNLSSGSVRSQLNELDTEKLALTGGTMSGGIAMGGQDITGADTIAGDEFTAASGEYGYASARTLRIKLDLSDLKPQNVTGAVSILEFAVGVASLPQSQGVSLMTNSGRYAIGLNKYLREGMVITDIRIVMQPGAARTGGNKFSTQLAYVVPDFTTPSNNPVEPTAVGTGTHADSSTSKQVIGLTGGPISHTVVRNGTSGREYWFNIKAGNTAATPGDEDLVWGIELVVDDLGPRN